MNKSTREFFESGEHTKEEIAEYFADAQREWRAHCGAVEPTPELIREARELFDKPTLSALDEERLDWFKRYYFDVDIEFHGTRYSLGTLAPRAYASMLYSVEANTRAAGVPRKYAGASLKNFQAPATGECASDYATIRSRIEEFLNGWDSGNRGKLGVFFFGQTGSGKTFAMAIIQQHFAARRIAHKWVDVRVWIQAMKDAMDMTSDVDQSAIFAEAAHAPVLFLDDLGSERLTDFSQDAIQRCLDQRYRDMMPTFISTNLEGQRLREALGDRIASRLHEMGLMTIKFPNYDWRRAKEKAA